MNDEKLTKAEDDMIYSILSSGNIEIIYELFGEQGINASIQLGAIKESEAEIFYAEQKFFEENDSNIIKTDIDNDSLYFDEIKTESNLYNFTELDSLLENLNEENISKIMDEMTIVIEKFKEFNHIPEENLEDIAKLYVAGEILLASPETRKDQKTEITKNLKELREESIKKGISPSNFDEAIEKERERKQIQTELILASPETREDQKIEIIKNLKELKEVSFSPIKFEEFLEKHPELKEQEISMENEK